VRSLPMSRMALLAAPLVLVGFAAGVVHGPHRATPDPPRQNRLAVQTEPVRRLSTPGPSREDEFKAQPLIPLEPPPSEASVASSPLPGSSIVGSTERAETVPALPSENLGRSIELYRKGDVAGGDRLREGLLDPVERRLGAWAAVHFGPVGFDRIMAFSRENADWPFTSALTRRAEETLLTARKPPGSVRSFFAERAPTTAQGKIALAIALRSDGANDEAAELVRDAWRKHTFGSEFEANILELFAGVLADIDHRERMERFLSRESWSSAIRVAGYAGRDHTLLAKARIAVAQDAADAQSALEAVPKSLRSERSYLLARAQLLRKQEKPDEAWQVLALVAPAPFASADGDQWWVERRLIARKLLDRGDAYSAYAVVRDNVAESVEKRIEAEFHAGWIALRFLNHPATAARHFDSAAQIATRPISIARTLYWQGRAAEALGASGEARGYFERAAGDSVTYYGQLARSRLGLPEVQLRAVEAGGGAAKAIPAVQAVKRLYEAGYRDVAFALCADLAASLNDPAQLDGLAQLVAEHGDARTLLTIGKTAVQRGYPLDMHAFPLRGVPGLDLIDGNVEKAIAYAIARQESAFAPDVQSSAGARGLMQLMPETARRTAKRLGIEFDVERLLDPEYNAKLGVAHLGELSADWKGSHLLMFASYNAGGGNVAKWIRAYGDPRSANVDPIDWIERIPFSETRNYVQRVIEGVLVYRSRIVGVNPGARLQEAGVSQANPVP
jgi:soluble lytic murein transglycosylase